MRYRVDLMHLRMLASTLAAFGCLGQVAAACPPPVQSSEIELFPSAKILPENLLRLYLYFPRPMSQNIQSSDIKLFDANGQEISQVFLPMRFELWSPDRRRLTLLLDPGRVKTGLVAHDALGRALLDGEAYKLHIPETLTDSEGCPLGKGVSFSFTAASSDQRTPEPADWQIDTPRAATRHTLSIDLGSPHDHISMAYRIRVMNMESEPVAGKIGIDANERVWTFTPREPWLQSEYRIVVDSRLEDLAGNRPGVLFDRSEASDIEGWVQELTFLPRL